MKTLRNYGDIPDNVFGCRREFSIAVRQRYELLFELIQKSGLRISEALGLRVRHVSVADGVAKHVRVIGKGDKERQVPLPESFGWVLALSLAGKTQDDYVFAKRPGGKPASPHAARAYLKKLVEKAAINKKVTPQKLRHTYAARLLEKTFNLLIFRRYLAMKVLLLRKFTPMLTKIG